MMNNKLENKILNLNKSAPFDVESFYFEYKDLIIKYLNKDTMPLQITDLQNLPVSCYYKRDDTLLSKIPDETFYTVPQRLEWIKCALDIVYFCKKYFTIKSIDKGKIKFDMYDYQEDLVRMFFEKRYSISMQSRQSGKTTTVTAYLLHFAIFNADKTIMCVAQTMVNAQGIILRVQDGYEGLPLFLQCGLKTYTKRNIQFNNGSVFIGGSPTSQAIRGNSASCLYIDEVAFLENDMQFYESTYPIIASGEDSRVIMTSTPNGARGLFYKIWRDSEEGNNNFAHKKVPWYMVPTYDEKWKEETIANTSPEQFRQEFELEFRGSANSLLSGATLEQLVVKKPKRVDRDGKFKVYIEPKPKHAYVAIVDVGLGKGGGDYSVITVIDLGSYPYQVAAIYRDNEISYLHLPTMIAEIGRQYNDAFVLVEGNNIGIDVAYSLKNEVQYENIIETYYNKGQGWVVKWNKWSNPYITTTSGVKTVGANTIKAFIEKGNILLNDEELIGEFGTLVPHKNSWAADSGAHDDIAMTLILFGWLTKCHKFKEICNIDFRQTYLNSDSEIEVVSKNPVTFACIIDNGIDDDFIDTDFFVENDLYMSGNQFDSYY